jgi:hypothetical protein
LNFPNAGWLTLPAFLPLAWQRVTLWTRSSSAAILIFAHFDLTETLTST